ncbi:MAG: NUDIX domain-containing protein [Anaerolineales bacterium]
MIQDPINFCPRCGAPVIQAERYGRIRPVCPSCGWIYFADPKVAVAILLQKDGQVLLVRRANDPRRGFWTLPAGFVVAGEDPVSAAEREALEETGLHVRIDSLLDVMYGQEHPGGAHIILFYRGEIISGEMHAHDDADRAAFFGLDKLPPLAFNTTLSLLAAIEK